MIADALTGHDAGIIIGVLTGSLGALGAFMWTVFRIARGVSQINRAVNHQGKDEPTLVERVRRLGESMESHDERAVETRDRLGSLERLSTARHNENRDTLADLRDGQEKIRRSLNRLAARTSKLEAVDRTIIEHGNEHWKTIDLSSEKKK